MSTSTGGPTNGKTTTAQLNVRIDQVLADRLRQRAKELHCSPGTLVAQAIEQLLDDTQPEVSPQAGDELNERLQSLETRVAALEREKARSNSQ
jgi:polyhydroxyalkanoate synthesis regulator phasin